MCISKILTEIIGLSRSSTNFLASYSSKEAGIATFRIISTNLGNVDMLSDTPTGDMSKTKSFSTTWG